jgi:AcrR family transcriptional regulator
LNVVTLDSPLRGALIEHAAALLAAHQDVTLRRLASEAGTSTMAVYTHFGGMPGVWEAVRQEGFRRLAAHLAEVEPSADPVADMTRLGLAYLVNALDNPGLYSMMFEAKRDPDRHISTTATFQVMAGAAQRCIDAGRLGHNTDANSVAIHGWVTAHGVATLVLSGALSREDMLAQLPSMIAALFTNHGDEPSAAIRSVEEGMTAYADRLASPSGGSANRPSA